MKQSVSSFLAVFGILTLMALAGFNPTANLPGVKEAAERRAVVEQMREQQQQK